MPKDRRVNSSSFDRAMVSPYSCSSKVSDRNNSYSSSPHAGDEREWEEARCSICMEHPHNAVLLVCSSRENGCRPFICDTSYRHSNCLDQFRKSSAASLLQVPEEQRPELICPLCRGVISGWDVIQPARTFMNAKTRSCSLETCNFSGNYAELRKHARLEHPTERPSDVSPTRQSNWTILEQQREIEDALAYQSDDDYDWGGWPSWEELGEDDFWSDGSFFDFPSGMSDVDDDLMDEMFTGLSLSFFSLYSSSPEEEMMDSGSSGSGDRLQRAAISTNSGSRSNNRVGNNLPSSRSRSSYHNENGAAISRSRSGYLRENDHMTNLRPRLSYHRENNSSFRSSYRRENAPTSSRTRSSYPREDGSSISRPRSSYHRENASASSRSRSIYDREYAQPSSGASSRYNNRREVAPPLRRSDTRHFPGSSRQPRPNFGRRVE